QSAVCPSDASLPRRRAEQYAGYAGEGTSPHALATRRGSLCREALAGGCSGDPCGIRAGSGPISPGQCARARKTLWRQPLGDFARGLWEVLVMSAHSNPTPQILEFDEAAHMYRVDGVAVPSVTELLEAAGISPDYSKVNPAVLRHARLRGLHVD